MGPRYYTRCIQISIYYNNRMLDLTAYRLWVLYFMRLPWFEFVSAKGCVCVSVFQRVFSILLFDEFFVVVPKTKSNKIYWQKKPGRHKWWWIFFCSLARSLLLFTLPIDFHNIHSHFLFARSQIVWEHTGVFLFRGLQFVYETTTTTTKHTPRERERRRENNFALSHDLEYEVWNENEFFKRLICLANYTTWRVHDVCVYVYIVPIRLYIYYYAVVHGTPKKKTKMELAILCVTLFSVFRVVCFVWTQTFVSLVIKKWMSEKNREKERQRPRENETQTKHSKQFYYWEKRQEWKRKSNE